MSELKRLSLTSVPGFTVGSAQDFEGCTGCTVVLAPEGGAVAAAVVRGPASSTRQMGIASPDHLVDRANAVFLAGGSAFGLDAAAGVMQFMAKAGRGFSTTYATVPVVPTAILYDLGLGSSTAHPTAEMAEEACQVATADPVTEGTVGVGTGATVGKLLTVRCATKGGLGSSAVRTDDGLWVGALAAVNAFGDVVDTERGLIVAGARRAPDSLDLIDSCHQIAAGRMRTTFGGTNTTLVVVATNAKLSAAWTRRVAGWACDGLATCLRPAFTAVDGDVVVALASEEIDAEPHRVGLLASRVVVRAVIRAVEQAKELSGVPAASEIAPRPMERY